MKTQNKKSIFIGLVIVVLVAAQVNAQPLALHPFNPHYFIYKGKPVVLITSAEHYGAVINSSLNYKEYLDVLGKNHFNLTRIFTGTYFESTFHDSTQIGQQKREEEENTLSVRPGKLLVPWARSNIPGNVSGGNKFDLDQWDSRYFMRLRDFCGEAAKRGIIVEIVLFSANYKPAYWLNSPLNSHNNINLKKDVRYNEIYLAANKALIRYQLAMVQKIVKELNAFDNIYFEICNEPYWLKGIPEVDSSIHQQEVTPEIYEWQKNIARTIKETEQRLPKKHLIAQNFANTYLKITNLDTDVSVLNFHYAYPPKTVTDNYSLNKPISFDETFDGLDATERRKEAWAFMMTGGAVYNNLDWSYSNDDMTGIGVNVKGRYKSGKPVKRQLEVLQNVLATFDIINAKPIDSTYEIDGMQVYGLGIKGKDYLIYLLKTKVASSLTWNMALPNGKYLLKWTDPSNGAATRELIVQVENKHIILKLPLFKTDQVLRIKHLLKDSS